MGFYKKPLIVLGGNFIYHRYMREKVLEKYAKKSEKPAEYEMALNKEKLEAIGELEKYPFLFNDDKVNVLMIIAGLKPATFMSFPGGQKEFQDAIDSLTKNLDIFNLPYKITVEVDYLEEGGEKHPIEWTTVYVGKNEEALGKLFEMLQGDTVGDRSSGLALGIPETAIEAFVNKEIMLVEDLPEEIQNSDEIKFLSFKLSRQYWREELGVARQRMKVTKKLAPDLYKQIIGKSLTTSSGGF